MASASATSPAPGGGVAGAGEHLPGNSRAGRRNAIRQMARVGEWLTRPLVVLLILACRILPEPPLLWASRPLGRLARLGRKDAMLAGVQLVLGGERFAGRAARDFWRAHTAYVGRTVIEAICLWLLPDEKMLARLPVDGEEHLSRVLAGGRGAILFLNHFGNPGSFVAGLGPRVKNLAIAGNAMDMTVAGEVVPLTYLETVVQRMFVRARVDRVLLGARLPHRAAEVLARNGVFGMFVDFPVGRRHNQPLAFGNARMSVNLGPAILALRHRTPVLCVTNRPLGGNRHQLTIHPPLEPAAAESLMQSALEKLLPQIRGNPENWWSWDWAQIS